MEKSLLNFMQKRQELRTATRDTKEERGESLEAQRTLNGLLTESMKRHNIDCIATSNGFVRVVQSTRKAPIKGPDDVRALLHEIQRMLPDKYDVGDVLRSVKSRLDNRASIVGPARATFVSQVPKKTRVVRHEDVIRETSTLISQYAQANREWRTGNLALKPLREAHREAERVALDRLAEPARVKVCSTNGSEKIVHVTRCERLSKMGGVVPTRTLLKHVEAAAQVVLLVRADDFDAFTDEVIRRIAQDEGAAKRFLKVQMKGPD